MRSLPPLLPTADGSIAGGADTPKSTLEPSTPTGSAITTVTGGWEVSLPAKHKDVPETYCSIF